MTGRTGLYVARDGSNNGTTPQGARLAQSGLIEWAGPNPLDTKQGVFYDTGTPVVAGTAGMSYDIRALVATGRLSAAAGPWIAANDATVNVVTGAAPGSNSRIDVIWCRQHLVAADGGADTDVILEFGVEQGVAAASPVIPTVPTGALALMRATVPSGTLATSGLTFTRMHEWVGGRAATAADTVVHIAKTADQSCSSDTTLNNDNHLFFTAEANSVYEVTGLLVNDPVNNIALAFQIPSGTYTGSIVYSPLDLNGSLGQGRTDAWKVASNTKIDDPASSIDIKARIKIGVTGGTVTLRWCQATSSVTPTTLFEDSWLTIRKVA